MKNRRFPAVTLALVGLLLTGSMALRAQGRIPDSPTGRMIKALLDFTHSSGTESLQAFLEERVVEPATGPLRESLERLRDEYPDAKIEQARKTGPLSAIVTLRSDEAGGNVEVSYEIEPDPPHGLTKLSITKGRSGGQQASGSIRKMPPALEKRLEAFVEAFNSGDPDTMLAFNGANTTEAFQGRRSDDEDRALYRRLQGTIGSLESARIEMTGEDEVTLTATTGDHGDIATLVFDVDVQPPHLIKGYSVNVDQAPQAGTLPDLEVPEGIATKEFASLLDAYLTDLARQDLFSGSVVLARKGDTVFEGAYGLANRETGVPNKTETLFDLGSITKTFTKVAVGQLIRDGKLAMGDTIADRIPDYPNPETARKVTVEHLLNHTSGLGDIFTDRFLEIRETLMSPRDFFPLFADEPLSFEPGEGRQYSNAGYVLLGAIVEAAGGQPYEQYIAKNIFEPAGMNESGFLARDGSAPNVAVGYTRRDWEGKSLDLRPNIDMLPIKGCPAGSSSSSAGDLLKFDTALREGRLLGPGWTRWFYTGVAPEKSKTAEGATQESAGRHIAFAGGGPGVNSALESDDTWVVIVLANMDPPVAGELARKVRMAARNMSG